MPVYTCKGDEGKTYLASGRQVTKDNLRVELYGTVDELNSAIGFAMSHLSQEKIKAKDKSKTPEISEMLVMYKNLTEEFFVQQHLLFDLGSELAGFVKKNKTTDNGKTDGAISDHDIELLEKSMDRMELAVGPMRNFILPGGSLASGALHLTRTICRRLERKMTEVMLQCNNEDEEKKQIIQKVAYRYINRLSDYLFMVARYANYLEGVEDIPWNKRISI